MFAAALLEAVGVPVQFQEVNVYGKAVGLCCNLFVIMVGAEGFEPPTLCSQSRCATRLRYAPTVLPDCIVNRMRNETDPEHRRTSSILNRHLQMADL